MAVAAIISAAARGAAVIISAGVPAGSGQANDALALDMNASELDQRHLCWGFYTVFAPASARSATVVFI